VFDAAPHPTANDVGLGGQITSWAVHLALALAADAVVNNKVRFEVTNETTYSPNLGRTSFDSRKREQFKAGYRRRRRDSITSVSKGQRSDRSAGAGSDVAVSNGRA
jgi:hypothetical protein